MKKRTSTIQTLRLQLDLSVQAMPVAEINKKVDEFKDRITQGVTQAMEEWDQRLGDRMVIIDKLEIDLQQCTPDGLTGSVRKALATRMAEVLHNKMPISEAPLWSENVSDDTVDQEPGTIEEGGLLPGSTLPESEYIKEELIYFLKRGRFKWVSSATWFLPAEKEFNERIEELAIEVVSVLFSVFSTEEQALVRFISLFPRATTRDFVQAYFKHKWSAGVLSGEIEAILVSGLPDSLGEGEYLIRYRELVKALRGTEVEYQALTKVVVMLLEREQWVTLPSFIIKVLSQLAEAMPEKTRQKLVAALKEPEGGIYPESIHELLKDPKQNGDPDSNTVTEPGNFVEEVPDNRWFAENAGLSLILPFLPHFFNTLKFTKGGKFISEKKQIKAIQILHYLATGKTTVPEHELAFPKLVCGAEAIYAGGKLRLTKQQNHECKELLESVKSYWPLLENTSLKNMTASFFQRPGAIVKQEKHYMVKIERHSIDVLLNSIQWGYSMNQLPWNEYLIKVEW